VKIKSILISIAISFLLSHAYEAIGEELNLMQSDENFATYNAEDLNDGEFLHDFLLLGPFPNPLSDGISEYFHTDEECLGFDKDYLISVGGESGVKPGVRQSVSFEDGEPITWQAHHSDFDRVDLKKIFTPNEGVICYAAIWIESQKNQEKLFGIGSNDGLKVWHNGKFLLKVHKPRTVNVDDEYLNLKLKKGRNLLLIKIEQGLGGWGFILRPVDVETAWKQVNENLDIALNSEFIVEDGFIKGTIGDRNIVGMLRGLPMAEIEFRSINSDHYKKIEAPLGTSLKLPIKEFPGGEYAITISFSTQDGVKQSYAYMNTSGDVVEQTKELIYKAIPSMPSSLMADYYTNFIETTHWLDKTNKLWQHPYGYRRYLDGLKHVHTEALKLSISANPFSGIFPAPGLINTIGGETKITSDWMIFDAAKSDDFIKAEIERVWKQKFNRVPRYTDDPDGKNTIRLLIATTESSNTNAGSYILQIESNRITITSGLRQGLYYGVNSLIQALEQNDVIPLGEIIDQPAFTVRSTLQTTTKLTPEFIQYIEQIARMKYNVVYISSGNYLDLDDKQKLKDIIDVFDFCKSRFTEPVPYFETFGAGTITRVMDPCLDEGIFHEKELWLVPDNGIIELDVPRIQDCPNTTIHIFTANGREIKKDSEYKILSTEKPKLQILNNDLFNSELLLSYDAVDFSLYPHPASCPSDPAGWKIQETVISNVITKLHPNSIHISQDEAGLINQCSRCLARNLSNKQIMIDQINRVHNIIRKYDPNIDICIWGDLFNDFQNAPMLGVEGAVEGLPKDIIIHDWNYVAVYHSDKMQTINQMNFYFNRGYRVGGVAWFEPANILDILLAGENKGNQFIGIMHTAWAGFDQSLYTTAEANWTGTTILGKLRF
jgi:hypothetical protein